MIGGAETVAAMLKPLNPAGAGLSLASPKSSSFDATVRQHDVRGLQIPVHNPCAVRRVERVSDLDRNLERLIDLDRPTLDLLVERLAFQVLHDQILGPVLVANVMERADVRMCESGNRFGLALEARLQLGIGRGKDLDRHRAIEACVARLVDFAEAARTERRKDVIRAEAGTR